MCSSFGQVYSDSGTFDITVGSYQVDFPKVNKRFFPYQMVPIIASKDKTTKVIEMSFSLVPSWSKDPKVKFATHNARIETVLEKPTWKKPFLSKHCLVPMTEFYESITEIGKPMAGNMVKFYEKDKNIIVAAGIYDEWVNQKTGEVLESFSILTTEPPNFVAETGHDRCPIFIAKQFYDDWLNAKMTGTECLDFLKSAKRSIDFEAVKDRALKPGWEKRS